jgi:hypothetical protein
MLYAIIFMFGMIGLMIYDSYQEVRRYELLYKKEVELSRLRAISFRKDKFGISPSKEDIMFMRSICKSQ